MRGLAAARTQYLGVVTPQFIAALDAVQGELGELPSIAQIARSWCGDLRAVSVSAAYRAELHAHCGGPELASSASDAVVEALLKAAAAFDAKRAVARESLVTAMANPDDASAVARAASALDDARGAAVAVSNQSRSLRPWATALSRDAAMLRRAIASVNTIQPGVATSLATYDMAGNALLVVEVKPAEASAEPVPEHEESSATFHFSVVDRHYLDFEAGLGITGGLPKIPSVVAKNGANVIQGGDVDQFVGLALVELEPLRIPWPDAPLAGVLRFPVLGVPLSRDPTQNFFVGAGLGWTGVGSLVAGPYLLRELTLRDGFALNESLPAGTSLGAATQPTLQVGYFVSASIDLLGLFHVFAPVHPPPLDAATGRQNQ